MSVNSVTNLEQYTVSIENIKKYYADLLILQYRNKPKARETIKQGVNVYLGDGVVLQLQDLLDIDSAIGAQLDIIGKILDCPRIVHGIYNDKNFFQFHINENSYGFSKIGDPTNALFKTRNSSNLSVYTLEDSDYRVLLKYKAAVNTLRGSLADMDEVLYSVFKGKVRIVNNRDLTITYIISDESMLAISAARSLEYFRAPLGINIFYIIVVPEADRIFGFNKANTPINGTTYGFMTKNNTTTTAWLNRNSIIPV